MPKSDVKIRKFYGDISKRSNKSWEQKKIKLERCANDFSQNPIIPTKHLRIDDPQPLFQTFSRQQMAFDYLKTCQQDVYVFAREKDCDGKRVYIVATLPQFWFKYTRMCLPENRNYYEVIPEGAACRLYFDLEFKSELNPGKDGAKMVETFIKYVCHHLKDMYDVNCSRKFVIDLDSSTPAKFSRHLIFHVPGAVFKDNIHAGNFVRHICTLLERKLGFGSEIPKNKDISTHVDCDTDNRHPTCQDEPSTENVHADDGKSTGDGEDESFASVSLQELSELIIKDGKGVFGTFCDQGVYTKNRNFRIFKSTKIGKNSHLLVSSQNTFKPSFKDRKGSFSKDPEYLLFLDSLISNVSMQVGGKDVKVLTCDSCAKSSKRPCQKESEYSASPPSSQSGYEHSPYPEIDHFISQVINKGGVQGEIRRWVFFPQGKLLTYDILKNRWCENIGRPHKSNHIMMVADLRLGAYYQKCHDPDCKNIDYRSPDKPIPEDINPLSSAQFSSDDCDDQELCNLAAEFEDQECNHRSSDSSNSEKQEILHTNGEYTTSTGNRETAQCDFDWDDEWDKEPFLDVQIQFDVRDVNEDGGTPSKSFLKQDKSTQVEGWQENKEGTKGSGEPLEDCNKEATLNGAEPTAVKSLCNQVIGTLASHPRGKDEPKPCESCGWLSLQKCYRLQICCSCENNEMAAALDEDACDWLEEDSISDLELSFAADEVESTTYQ